MYTQPQHLTPASQGGSGDGSLGFLPLMQETWIEFLAPGSNLAWRQLTAVGIWGLNYQQKFSFCLPFK